MRTHGLVLGPEAVPADVSVLASGGQQRSPGGHAEQSWAVMLTP